MGDWQGSRTLVYDPDLSQMVNSMHEFWSVHGLGSVTLSGTDPISLTVQGCLSVRICLLPVMGLFV
jgi:hypothetical protein